MKKKEFEENRKKELEEDSYFMKQCQHNSKIPGFEVASINTLIIELLTKLTGQGINGKRYIDYMLSDMFHQNIQDLDILYKIRQSLESSNKCKN